VLARDHGLRVMQRERARLDFGASGERRQRAEAAQCVGIARMRGVQQ
jgi:hypothetical protein